MDEERIYVGAMQGGKTWCVIDETLWEVFTEEEYLDFWRIHDELEEAEDAEKGDD